ncbi:MATE efflux family [Olea europaea subsp. europaea]|uniref:MATE efflux family n=1 Tax=Olea europaea subsp. europaea TaxID=158383 RepID=A0A8S0RP24_OLEEU|nr:MATE efflux family [Olea europaea subsp. europaea]
MKLRVERLTYISPVDDEDGPRSHPNGSESDDPVPSKWAAQSGSFLLLLPLPFSVEKHFGKSDKTLRFGVLMLVLIDSWCKRRKHVELVVMGLRSGAPGAENPLLQTKEAEAESWWWKLNKLLDVEEAKDQISLSVPLILANASYCFITLVSVMFVGHLGELKLAAANLANSY